MKTEYINPTACSDPEQYIHRCTMRRRQQSRELDATINAVLRVATVLLIWAAGTAFLVGAL